MHKFLIDGKHLLKNETDEKKVEIFLKFAKEQDDVFSFVHDFYSLAADEWLNGQINLEKRKFFFFYYLNNYLIRTSAMDKNDYILKFFNEYKETFKKIWWLIRKTLIS